MTDHYTKQILSVFNGKVDIRMLSDEVVNLFLEVYPYSPYGHLVHYLKARATNRPDAQQLLHKLATYSPDRAWLQEVLKSSLARLDMKQEAKDPIPSEAINPNLDQILFEFDFDLSKVQPTTALEEGEQVKLEHIDEQRDIREDIVQEHPNNESTLVETTVETPNAEVSNEEVEELDKKEEETAEEKLPISDYTTWLKSLNKNVQPSIEENLDLPELETQASSPQEPILESTTRKEDDVFGGIITETLADLLANQGQVDKAIGMYNRLSLIFPEKSSFFAAKIAELKKK